MSLRVAVIGVGAMGSNHLRVLREWQDDSLHLVGIADTDEHALQRAVRRFSVVGFDDYRQMVEWMHPELVVVAVPTCLHFEIVRFLLEAGVHVLVEKPIAETVDQAETLVKLARRQGVKFAVGHVERFNPAISFVKRRLLQGELGRIFLISARRLGPFPSRVGDVGVILDLATHDIDVMRYLLDAEIEHVYAATQQHLHQHHEDLLFGMLHFANGTLGALDINWLTPTKLRELSLTGEKGMYTVNYLTQDVFWHTNDYSPTSWHALSSFTGVSEGTMTRFRIQKAEPLQREYEDMVAAICEDRLPMVSGEDGLAALRVAHHLCQAARLPGVGERISQ